MDLAIFDLLLLSLRVKLGSEDASFNLALREAENLDVRWRHDLRKLLSAAIICVCNVYRIRPKISSGRGVRGDLVKPNRICRGSALLV